MEFTAAASQKQLGFTAAATAQERLGSAATTSQKCLGSAATASQKCLGSAAATATQKCLGSAAATTSASQRIWGNGTQKYRLPGLLWVAVRRAHGNRSLCGNSFATGEKTGRQQQESTGAGTNGGAG